MGPTLVGGALEVQQKMQICKKNAKNLSISKKCCNFAIAMILTPTTNNILMKKLLLFFALICSLQMMVANLVVEHRSGADLLQDISLIGKWVFVGEDLQLLDKQGNTLATEPLANIKKITFSVSTATENVQTNAILVYPNPTQDVLMIQGIDAQTLRVYDMQGRLLMQENGTQLGVGHLAEGTYLLQIGTQVVRFIKK